MFPVYVVKRLSRIAFHLGGKRLADDEEIEKEVQK
jgi:hypothetical protein